eukprot:1322036-Alexandrium_andersonii.AAC.1
MSASLVGSEMCIRDRVHCSAPPVPRLVRPSAGAVGRWVGGAAVGARRGCLLYTSDAADDM